MIEGISPLVASANNMLYKSKRQQGSAFSYNSEITIAMSEKNGGSVNINEEYERSVSESVGKRVLASAEPTYSLSELQAEYLSGKYDLDNMPQNSVQEREFLNELVSMNVISEKDAKLFNFNCGGSVESVSSYVSAVPFDENNMSEWSVPMWENCYNDSDSIIDRLTAVIETQKNISNYYADKCGGDIETAKKCDSDGLTASQEFLAAKLKIMSVLQDVKSGKNYNTEYFFDKIN